MNDNQRLGLFIVGNYDFQNVLDYAKIAEANGFDSIWLAEDLGMRDAIVPLSALSSSTKSIKLATGILPIHYRTPSLTAMTAATLHELSRGRFILGLGSGAPHFLAAQGLDASKPLNALREYVYIVRQILDGNPLRYNTHLHNLTDVRLSFKPPRTRIPIYIAARQKNMLQLAGEIADGVFLSDGLCSDIYLRWAVENVKRGAEKSGRRPKEIDLSCVVLLSVSKNHDSAKENVKPCVLADLAEGYLDPFLNIWGLTVADVTPARDAWLRGRTDEACKKIPDPLLDAAAIYGTPDECRKKMERLRDTGVSMPVIRPVDPNVKSIIESAKNW